jgi:hypothetical protein
MRLVREPPTDLGKLPVAAEKDIHQHRIEMRAAVPGDPADRFLVIRSVLVGPAAGDGVVGVRESHDAGSERDVESCKAARIS